MGTPSASLQHSTGIRPTALLRAAATFLGHRAAGQRLPSPGGVPQHPLLPPPGKAAAGKGPMFSRSHIHSSGAQTKAQAAASRAQDTPNPTHLWHRAAALPQGINPFCNRSAGQQGLGQLLFPWLSLRMCHHWKAQICVVSCPAGAGCSPSSWWRISFMLGLSWGFTVIMEKSRRCNAAEYLVVEGNVRGF